MAEVAKLETWKNRLACKKNGDWYADERNVKLALELIPELRGLLCYDEFSDRVELTRPPPGFYRDELDKVFEDDEHVPLADEHITGIIIYLTEQGFTGLTTHVVQDVAVLVAKAHASHPVREYLKACLGAWDSRHRLDLWLHTYLGANDDPSYLADVGSKFLIGAVARILDPGCQMDSILVLEGEQGEGKSRAVSTLGGTWTYDLSGDLGDKDAAMAIQKVWIAELSELTALRRSEQEPVKAFISRRVDHYRPPYGRNTITRPRHTVFIATTNEGEYLQDPTGARRFWPVACQRIDLIALARDRDQLWGEAVSRYRAKEPWHLTQTEISRARREQSARQKVSVVDATILEYLDAELARGETRIEMRQLLRDVFECSSKEDPHKAAGLGAITARVLISQGWKRLKPTGRGDRRVQAYEAPSQSSQTSQSVIAECEDSDSQSSQSAQSETENFDDEIPF